MAKFKVKLEGLTGKKIAFLGLGRENTALLRFFLGEKLPAIFTVCDQRDALALGRNYRTLKRRGVNWKLGQEARSDLDGFDILLRSPGWPLFDPEIAKAVSLGVAVTSPMQLFFDLCPSRNIIGVTGTKGKGTTAALIQHIFQAARRRAWLGGNIGVAPFEFIARIKKTDWVILELSSFQLEDLAAGPRGAVITNFTPEHLAPADPLNPNYHRSLREYWQAKTRLFKGQGRGDWAVIDPRLKIKIKALAIKSRVVFYEAPDWPTRLIGAHNRENIGAAAATARLAGVKEEVIKKAVAAFSGLEHRLELAGKKRGVRYYNDSFATTPEAGLTALRSFAPPIVLIAGGAEKNSRFKRWEAEIKKKVKFVVLLRGAATARIKKELAALRYPRQRIKITDSMPAAVRLAAKEAAPGDVVLLSPACASFGLFKNYKERGMLFKQAVRKL
ncbi:MAG: UDP-N-acetylmuramoyl-L-alanine--D-glutamate ligase [Planctomycetes bacterium]|jgi:UDP-N-acetylmuramoylalanine--D-glutamate ligase|nr:UDP-N-acetylmuramoyl-L-alanine--D-glutamate ligase [Planctomycetota bacterium]